MTGSSVSRSVGSSLTTDTNDGLVTRAGLQQLLYSRRRKPLRMAREEREGPVAVDLPADL